MSGPTGNDGDGIAALSYILAGLILYGVLGWLADRWLGTRFLLPAGLILGLGLGAYLVIKRFGARS
ncbi:MAG: AtpZ/AtpI family protein [Propionibacteriaceae bacterium]|jgi:F0F1-type ATP synthase assembly protein I|nr:AtpZ/AtpI family protein [Propionibacteriaceae bacterium]